VLHIPADTATPHHVAEALAALDAHRLTEAGGHLLDALADKHEPGAAQAHAQEALAALRSGGVAEAKMSATSGAGVEHFTYALLAMSQGRLTGTGSTSDHLREASHLAHFKSEAQAALAAIRRGDLSAAKLHAKAGLKTAKGA
jgi:hypothetical protein